MDSRRRVHPRQSCARTDCARKSQLNTGHTTRFLTLIKRVDAIARENAAADNGSAATSGDDAQDDDAREAARKEELRQERRKVIALNKLGEAAEAVRRTWIREKLRSRKTAPKGGARFVAQCLTRDIRLVEEYHGSGIAAELLGLGDSAAMNTHARELGVNADGRAQVVTLALVLAHWKPAPPKTRGATADVATSGAARWISCNSCVRTATN